jgi:hypothetical protein
MKTETNALLPCDDLIKNLGRAEKGNEYIIEPDKNGNWWITHKHVGSGEPLMQWLTGNHNLKICPQCGRIFCETEVPSGKFCCYACENGY